ncbi:ribosomal protein S5 domain 2-type protein [Phyllosticta capitalensis]
MNPALEDEIEAINSIYDEDTLVPNSDSSTSGACILRLPSLPSVALRFDFPADYPDAPPSILGTHSVGDDVPKGFGTRVVDVVRDVLAQVYRPGEPCVFDLLEEVGEVVQRERAADEAAGGAHEQTAGVNHDAPDDEDGPTSNTGSRAADIQVDQLGPEPPWALSEPAVEKKSVFLARAARVTSPQEAKGFVQHLVATDKKAAKATHNITAWRIRGANDAVYQDCDDDGETAAGGRLLHLMQLMDIWDAMVVVTRWYGGIHLGPDRFRIINQTAREAFVLGGFVKEEKEKGNKKKGKK